ncbi:hypothetical protein Tco_0002068 [Tanacetum coccineum]
MSTPEYIYPIIVPSDFDIKDAFSSTYSPNYTPASPDYSLAFPGNTSSDPSEDLSKDLLASLAISPFHDDPYMKVMQAYNATSNGSPISLSPSSSIGSSSPVRSTTPPPDYPFDESIFAEMTPNRTSTSAAPAMTQAAIRKLVADSVAAALEAQVATMANADNTNRNTRQGETPIARKCSYK